MDNWHTIEVLLEMPYSVFYLVLFKHFSPCDPVVTSLIIHFSVSESQCYQQFYARSRYPLNTAYRSNRRTTSSLCFWCPFLWFHSKNWKRISLTLLTKSSRKGMRQVGLTKTKIDTWNQLSCHWVLFLTWHSNYVSIMLGCRPSRSITFCRKQYRKMIGLWHPSVWAESLEQPE